MQWSPNDVLRLLASDKPLIGGVGRMRVQKPNSDPAVWCWRPLRGRRRRADQDDMGAIEVKGFGAAFMLINRRVLHDMATAHPEWKRAGANDWPQDLARQLFRVLPHRRGGLRHRVRRGLRVLQSLASAGLCPTTSRRTSKIRATLTTSGRFRTRKTRAIAKTQSG
jgi:hypothetical protein